MVKIIKLNIIFCIFILASCSSNKAIEGVDWNAPKDTPVYVQLNGEYFHLERPPPPPQINLPSLAEVPHYTPTNQPTFIPPPPPFDFIIDFGD